jgi:hypothetical protein
MRLNVTAFSIERVRRVAAPGPAKTAIADYAVALAGACSPAVFSHYGNRTSQARSVNATPLRRINSGRPILTGRITVIWRSVSCNQLRSHSLTAGSRVLGQDRLVFCNMPRLSTIVDEHSVVLINFLACIGDSSSSPQRPLSCMRHPPPSHRHLFTRRLVGVRLSLTCSRRQGVVRSPWPFGSMGERSYLGPGRSRQSRRWCGRFWRLAFRSFP